MALIQLESGGRMPAGKRFEKHVFARLKEVQGGDRAKYEHVEQSDLLGANDEALQNLATSWGTHGIQMHPTEPANPGHPGARCRTRRCRVD
jgi:hypothetical protein